MRYIDADALKETLKDLKAEGNDRKFVKGLQDAIDVFFPQIIDDEPTADVEPIRHAWWIRVGGDDYECSECKAAVWSRPSNPIERYKYCWNCGAIMDGGEQKCD